MNRAKGFAIIVMAGVVAGCGILGKRAPAVPVAQRVICPPILPPSVKNCADVPEAADDGEVTREELLASLLGEDGEVQLGEAIQAYLDKGADHFSCWVPVRTFVASWEHCASDEPK